MVLVLVTSHGHRTSRHQQRTHRRRILENLTVSRAKFPHRGLPPGRGGGAYAPMTRAIFNLKERS